MGIRLLLEIVADRITETFPTMSPFVLNGTLSLLSLMLLLLLLFLSICLLADNKDLVLVCLWFAFTYGLHATIMNTYVS